MALGSRFPGHLSNTAAYDYLPSAILAEVANLGHFTGMLAVDKWVTNEDFRQAIFVRERAGGRSAAFGGAPSSKRLFAHFVDHGLAFQGAKWEFRDAPLAGKFRDSTVYSHVRGIEDFEPYLEAIGQFPADELERIVASVPPQWLGRNDQAVLSGLCRQLLDRRQRVPDLIIAARRTAPESFPRWV